MVLVEPQDFWQDLFGHEEGGSEAMHLEMRMVRKHGRPFLLLPRQPRAAVAVVDLYPAQTLRARVARKLLRWLLHAPVAVGTARIALTLSAEDAFVKLLASLAGTPASEVPTFGILAGNPASDGQRFLILVFDTNQKPVAVVKAGLTARAIELIRHEELFLRSVPGRIEGIPALRATFDSSRMRALVLDFFSGDSPRVKDEDAIARLLRRWVHRQKELRLSELSGWTRLASSSAIAWFPALARRIGQQRQAFPPGTGFIMWCRPGFWWSVSLPPAWRAEWRACSVQHRSSNMPITAASPAWSENWRWAIWSIA